MSFIGYNEPAYKQLITSVEEKQTRLSGLMEKFDNEIIPEIKKCWVGPDADKYVNELAVMVSNTKEKTNKIYQTMKTQFEQTHAEWVKKQQG